jgi:hypothetical protein
VAATIGSSGRGEKYASLCACDFTTATDWKEIWQLALNVPTIVDPV